MLPPGRRERKKAETRRKIADTARRLFLERGYDAVGIRDVAAEADVAVTTVFAHFASKEALVFQQDQEFEQGLVRAVTDRTPDEPLVPALRREVLALVRHCTADGSAPIRRMIEASPALRAYEDSMMLRHAQALAAAVAADPGQPRSATACRALARFAVDAYGLAREADDPQEAVDEVFRMIGAAWGAAAPAVTPAAGTATGS
ncbi:TetR/AcrR family transcriptional regulator [Kitasatospora sp. NPDC101176]|uniref:TetR/AcrR family transcriptional regulator n=1 Tax=Kitasatospora sp. NPDC101176 TaxID=3364099 RepID=UPI0038058719